MNRDNPLQDLALTSASALLILFALAACIATAIRGASAAGDGPGIWGNYETAARLAFMRDETRAFDSVTIAAEALPKDAGEAFVKTVIVGLGLADESPDSLTDIARPEDYQRVREALQGFANADELMAMVKREAVEKAPEPVPEPIEEPAPIEAVNDAGNRGVIMVRPVAAIEPREAVRP